MRDHMSMNTLWRYSGQFYHILQSLYSYEYTIKCEITYDITIIRACRALTSQHAVLAGTKTTKQKYVSLCLALFVINSRLALRFLSNLHGHIVCERDYGRFWSHVFAFLGPGADLAFVRSAGFKGSLYLGDMLLMC